MIKYDIKQQFINDANDLKRHHNRWLEDGLYTTLDYELSVEILDLLTVIADMAKFERTNYYRVRNLVKSLAQKKSETNDKQSGNVIQFPQVKEG